ncbi:MAG: HAD family phosphatase [Pirellulaceae bacterium]|nr:HAD family phosphatase [Pirellulaceae bacterium]
MNQPPSQPTSWPHPLRAVAFDMDGLLVNTEQLYTQVGHVLLERRGRRFTSQLKDAMTGLPSPQAFELMIQWESLSDTVETLEAESDALFAEILPQQLALLEGVHQLLDHVDRAGWPRCVATSSSPGFADSVLRLVSIRERFDFVITAHDVPRGKPHPDIYHAAAQRMGVPTEQMMVLEDSHHGCKAGVTAGACTIAVPGEHSCGHDFSGAHWRAPSLLDPTIVWLLAGNLGPKP